MKIALISDIHANLPALEAVLKDIEGHLTGDIHCLGDLVNFAGWKDEQCHVPYDTKKTLHHTHLVNQSYVYDELVCFGEHS